MKLYAVLSIILVSLVSSLGNTQTLLKTCKTVLVSPDGSGSIPTTFQIQSSGNAFMARVTQTAGGKTSAYDETATVSFHEVRKGLSSRTSGEKLNLAESLIVHAMMLSSDPILKDTYYAGLELSDVRSAHVYVVGKFENMGGTAIVEAKDASGRYLGSFLGGFVLAPCR